MGGDNANDNYFISQNYYSMAWAALITNNVHLMAIAYMPSSVQRKRDASFLVSETVNLQSKRRCFKIDYNLKTND